ncbi:hypothetical protein BRC64_00755 [Halobacteriales archaeon QH_10_67_22]|nr:MAG: hypothetical protein BRC64_00755 [Halobacteriales archaeon QH_10_67_22]
MQRRRLVVLSLLVVALAGSFVHYGAVSAAHRPYPTTEELMTNPDGYVGQQLLLTGPVSGVDTANGTLTMAPSRSYPDFEMVVEGVDRSVTPGGTVQVFGRLTPDGTVAADTVLVVNASFAAELYKYGVSVAGAALVLVAFFRRWRPDTGTLSFEVREDD